MKLFKNERAPLPLWLTALVTAVLLSACDSEGIDRLQNDAASTSQSNTQSSAITPRFVQLEKISFEATLPSIISVMFQATDRFGGAIAGLQTGDFQSHQMIWTKSKTQCWTC